MQVLIYPEPPHQERFYFPPVENQAPTRERNYCISVQWFIQESQRGKGRVLLRGKMLCGTVILQDEKATLACQEEIFLSYFGFITTCVWVDGSSSAVLLPSYFLFYVYFLFKILVFSSEARRGRHPRARGSWYWSFQVAFFLLTSLAVGLVRMWKCCHKLLGQVTTFSAVKVKTLFWVVSS